MDNNLFQNDRITGNSTIGFEIKGKFNDDENIILNRLKDIVNRNISFSNIGYKLLEPTENNAILIKNGNYCEIKTPMYSYFEAIYILPKILDFLKSLKEYNNSYLYFKIGFNNSFCDISKINILKFILEYNEDYILKSLSDISKNGSIEKLSDIKPENLESCTDNINIQLNKLKFMDNDIYGINFSTLNLGYITIKYAKDINYRNKWEEIMKCINHTIITLYNTSAYSNLTDDEMKKISDMNGKNMDFQESFRCYELFKERYKGIKLTKDLDNDTMSIDVIFPGIKDKLFDIVIRNGIRNAEINYDSDLSKLQLKNIELKKCYHLSGVDIVDGEIENCSLSDCDIYDTKIEDSTVTKCNLFGYATCKDSKFDNCFISRNINLTNCKVCGKLGKMGGTMNGGSLTDTTVITSMAELKDVEKNNVNEIQ